MGAAITIFNRSLDYLSIKTQVDPTIKELELIYNSLYLPDGGTKIDLGPYQTIVLYFIQYSTTGIKSWSAIIY